MIFLYLLDYAYGKRVFVLYCSAERYTLYEKVILTGPIPVLRTGMGANGERLLQCHFGVWQPRYYLLGLRVWHTRAGQRQQSLPICRGQQPLATAEYRRIGYFGVYPNP